MNKNCLYFRGRLYKDTFRNRVVGRMLTLFYKLSTFFPVLIINVLFACSPAVKYESEHLTKNDSILCDSFSYSGHCYVCFKSSVFNHIEHSPDCACRYNRTFIVIKRGSK